MCYFYYFTYNKIISKKIFNTLPYHFDGAFAFITAAKNGNNSEIIKLLNKNHNLIYEFDEVTLI